MAGVYKMWFGFRDHLPKKCRYTLGDKVDARFLLTLELLFTASYQSRQEKTPTLERALCGIDTLKFLLRIAWDIGALDDKKYAALSEGLDTAGRQVGGWKKGLQTKTPAG